MGYLVKFHNFMSKKEFGHLSCSDCPPPPPTYFLMKQKGLIWCGIIALAHLNPNSIVWNHQSYLELFM